MAKFLTSRGTTLEIENIINKATSGLVLISPFIRIPGSLFQNLKAADQRGMKISIVYGKNQLEPNTLKQLKELKNAKLYFLSNLHAKCYFNEQSMVITSLNLYDFSEQNNREMGVLINKQEDQEVFTDAVREARMIISLATRSDSNIQVAKEPEKQVQPQKNQKLTKSIWQEFSDAFTAFFGPNRGFCIGCRTEIEFDEYRPYCPGCYGKWVQNKRQKAQYCHECGKPSITSINKPLCRSCFEKSIR